ncbi:MAG: hypothetical protein ABUL64_01075, partial [Singulisphaera sp.]
MPLEDSSPWLCGLALAIPTAMILASLAVARRYVRGTTLVAPWCWAIVAVALVAAVDGAALLSGSGMTPAWLSAARYLAAIATFCPLMAVLGAKRPQDRAWQLIVLALWFVLALP